MGDYVSIKSIYLKTDVTAIKVYNEEWLLAGIGGNLHICNVKDTSKKSNKVVNIFHGQNIHGIKISKNKTEILLYGGPLISLLDVTLNSECLIPTARCENILVEDWILLADFNESGIKLVTANNKVVLLNKIGNATARFTCEERCLLYSAAMVENLGTEDLVVLSGTVFSEVLIWIATTPVEDNLVLHRLKGHNGVIFSISCKIEHNLITTTSDDRSVRIWKIERNVDKTKNCNLKATFEDCSIVLQHTLYGHTARVRNSKILNTKRLIVSTGEDSNICTWNFDGILVTKQNGHQNGSIWSFDCDEINDVIYTGGSDGGVLSHRVVLNESVARTKELNFPVQNTDEEIHPRKVAYTVTGDIICVTFNGDLYFYNKAKSAWSLEDSIDEFKSYCILNANDDMIALAGLLGNVRIYSVCRTSDEQKCLELIINTQLFTTRIISVHLISYNLIIGTESGSITSYNIVRRTSDYFLSKGNGYLLPKSKDRWVTSAAIFNKLLIIGDRKGGVFTFCGENVEPKQSFCKAHSHLGVTKIVLSGNTIVSMGRDGSVKKYYILNNELNIISDDKMPFDWIENVINYKNVEITAGFLNKSFVFYSSESKKIIHEINCGGGHRSFDLSLFENRISFVFVKNNSVHESAVMCEDVIMPCIIQGSHVKEIYALESLPVESGRTLLFSVGEDNCIRVGYFVQSHVQSHYTEIISMQIHLSSIRTLFISKISNKYGENTNTYLVFTGGGRAQLCVTEVASHIANGDITSRFLTQQMLKGSDKQRKSKSWQEVQTDFNSETRYMFLHGVNLATNSNGDPQHCLLLIAGCSDGGLRIFKWIYKENNYDLQLISNITYYKRCVLKVHSFKHQGQCIVLTMATDGKVAFWNFTECIRRLQQSIVENMQMFEESKPFHVLTLHQSGINSFALEMLQNGLVLLATGGDDNKIVLSLLRLEVTDDRNVEIAKLCCWENSTTHSSQITGVKIYNGYLLTTSIDQRLVIFQWSICENNQELNATYMHHICTCVSDIQGMDIYEKKANLLNVIIYGKGMEVIEINTNNK